MDCNETNKQQISSKLKFLLKYTNNIIKQHASFTSLEEFFTCSHLLDFKMLTWQWSSVAYCYGNGSGPVLCTAMTMAVVQCCVLLW